MSDLHERVLAATAGGLYLGGRTEPIAFGGRHVRGLTRTAERLYAIVARHEIWQCDIRDEAPASWRWGEIARIDDQAWSLHVRGGLVRVGTEGAQIVRVRPTSSEPGARAVRSASFESHPDRENWFTPWGGPPAVRSMSASSEGALYANVHVGGILRSDDDGESWKQTIDIGLDVHQVLVHGDASIVLAPAGKGFAESRDQGASWRVSTDGLDFTYMRAVAVSGDTLLASASNGPHGDRGAVYTRRLDSTDSFRRCTAGLPEWFDGNVDTFCLATGTGSAAPVAVGAPGGSIFVSGDSGASWEEAASSLPEINAVTVVG